MLKITLVMPSFNQAEYIDTALASVVSQRYRDLQFIVMDGGSDDGSKDIIEKYASKIDYWVSQKDGGQSDAIRKGFEIGDGEVLGWLNSDDALLPGALEFVGEYFNSNPEIDILLGGIAYIDSGGSFTKVYTYARPRRVFVRNGVIAFGQQSMFFRRELYNRIGGIRKDFHYLMDTEFLYRAVLSGAKFGTCRKILGAFRWHEDMKSINRIGRKYEEGEIVKNVHGVCQAYTSAARFAKAVEQVLNGNFIYGIYQTRKMKGKTIDSVWGGSLESLGSERVI